MPTTGQIWLWAIALPAISFLCQNLCVWPAPRFLGVLAVLLLSAWGATVLLVLAAIPASGYFAATSLAYWNKDGEFVRRISMALSCLLFIGLWILAFWSANLLRHRAFVQASRANDRFVQSIARYRDDKGEYPDRLEQLVPGYLEAIPYTGMIAYPEFSYCKDYNDIQSSPGSFELRIDCTSGGINFDRFIYWPSETYPDRIQNNHVERIGR